MNYIITFFYCHVNHYNLEIKKETEKLSISYSLKSKNQAPASFQLALASFKIPAKVFFSSSFSIAI